MPTRRKYRRITAADNSTTVPNRTTFPQGTFYQPPLSNPSTAVNGYQGQPYSMLPSSPKPNNPFALRQTYNQPQTVVPANVSTANSFSGWNAQNTKAVSNALSPATGLKLYQQSERGAPGSPYAGGQPLYNNVPVAGQQQYQMSERSGFDVTTQVASQLNAGQLPQTLTPQTIAQLTASGYDINQIVNFYQPDGQGSYKLNAQGIQAQTQAASQPSAPSQNPLSDPRNTKAYQYYAENNVSFVNQQRWDPQRKKYVKIGQLIKEGRLDVRDKRARLKRARPGRNPNNSQSAIDMVSEPQLSLGSASAFVNFNTATG